MQHFFRAILKICIVSVASVLTGCSGGGGDGSTGSPPSVSTTAFPLQSGYKKIIASGLSKSFTMTAISGTKSCSGNGSKTSTPATTAAVFEGVTGLSATTTLSVTVPTSCTPPTTVPQSTTTTTTIEYFDSNYMPLGSKGITQNSYSVYTAALVIPISVSVGETGQIGTQILYSSSTKSTKIGSIVLSYVIEPDTSSTAIVNLRSKVYDTAEVLGAIEEDRYRIDAQGTLTPISVDIQIGNSTDRVNFTFN
jgi:hypothetical protein